jgi:hypothetical protein
MDVAGQLNRALGFNLLSMHETGALAADIESRFWGQTENVVINLVLVDELDRRRACCDKRFRVGSVSLLW